MQVEGSLRSKLRNPKETDTIITAAIIRNLKSVKVWVLFSLAQFSFSYTDYKSPQSLINPSLCFPCLFLFWNLLYLMEWCRLYPCTSHTCVVVLELSEKLGLGIDIVHLPPIYMEKASKPMWPIWRFFWWLMQPNTKVIVMDEDGSQSKNMARALRRFGIKVY